MSVENQAEESASEPVVVSIASVGQCLSAAREEQGISVEDVARSLKLAIRQIEALESDDYDRLPGVTFIKGFIRNYAKFLQLDPEPLVARLQNGMPGAVSQAIISPNERIEISSAGTKAWPWLVMLVIVVIVAVPLLIYEKLHTEVQPVAPVIQEVAPVAPAAPVPPAPEVDVPVNDPEAVQPPVPDVQNMPTDTQGTPPAALPAAAKPDGAPQPAAVVGSGAGIIKMNFSKNAWVEVRDKSGNRIYSQLNAAGSEQVVRGNPPMTIVVGNASSVTVVYNGKPVDLAPYIKIDVARLTLE